MKHLKVERIKLFLLIKFPVVLTRLALRNSASLLKQGFASICSCGCTETCGKELPLVVAILYSSEGLWGRNHKIFVCFVICLLAEFKNAI